MRGLIAILAASCCLLGGCKDENSGASEKKTDVGVEADGHTSMPDGNTQQAPGERKAVTSGGGAKQVGDYEVSIEVGAPRPKATKNQQ